MKCKVCSWPCKKAGKQSNGTQKYCCKNCGKYQQRKYKTKVKNKQLILLLKEGCSIRSMARITGVSPSTVIRRIKRMAAEIQQPRLAWGKEFEMDELRTYVGSKSRPVWLAYAIRRDTREVVDFRLGSRSGKMLRPVVETLLLSDAQAIYTDRLKQYRSLVPKSLHRIKIYQINHIERMNLTLRTHLKRLNRRTICFSRSLSMLTACVRIYFWA